MHTGPTPRHLRPLQGYGHGFTTRTQFGLNATQPRELPKEPVCTGIAPRLLTVSIRLLLIILVVLVMTILFFLFGEDRSEPSAYVPDATPQVHAPHAAQWGTETE